MKPTVHCPAPAASPSIEVRMLGQQALAEEDGVGSPIGTRGKGIRPVGRTIDVLEHPVLRAIAGPVVADRGAVAIKRCEGIGAAGRPAATPVLRAAVAHVIAA